MQNLTISSGISLREVADLSPAMRLGDLPPTKARTTRSKCLDRRDGVSAAVSLALGQLPQAFSSNLRHFETVTCQRDALCRQLRVQDPPSVQLMTEHLGTFTFNCDHSSHCCTMFRRYWQAAGVFPITQVSSV